VCACVCARVCVTLCVSTPCTVARIRLKLCEVSLRITESCTGYLLFTCERYARASTARTCAYAHYWTDSLGSHTRAWQNWFFYVCACVCTLSMRACVRSHIVGRIRSTNDENIPLHVLRMLFTRSHIIGRILSKIDGDIPWVTETCTAYLMFTCAFAHFWTY
jgi:hypothetical protein